MSEQITAFYRKNTEVTVDFAAEGVSSDGTVVLLETLERNHKVIRRFTRHIPDQRDSSKVEHSVEKLLKQHVFTLMQGYEDCNDAEYLKNDPLFRDVLEGDMASQPMLSRLENSVDKHAAVWVMPWLGRSVCGFVGRPQRDYHGYPFHR